MKEKIEAVLLEEIRGEQEITDFYNLVNSPVTPSSKEHNIMVQTSASKTIHTRRYVKHFSEPEMYL